MRMTRSRYNTGRCMENLLQKKRKRGPPLLCTSLWCGRCRCCFGVSLATWRVLFMALYRSLDSLVGVLFVNEPGINELRILLTLLDEGTLGDEVLFRLEDMARTVCDMWTNISQGWCVVVRYLAPSLLLSRSESEPCRGCWPKGVNEPPFLVPMRGSHQGRVSLMSRPLLIPFSPLRHRWTLQRPLCRSAHS
ncbi:hypothetical protein EDB83DRAFT_2357453 [Lactarius deliciosus]|nr:hypothetical protein EDB83DRAFT_2357453 [Lactarius deliciosus]